MKELHNIRHMVLASLCMALGLALPSLFHMFGAGGPAFLPMHIPVLICGFICGPLWGGICGMLLPLASSLLTGMPVMPLPGLPMVFELCAYGALTGLISRKYPVYPSLVGAMLAGRAVSGLAQAMLLWLLGGVFKPLAFLTAAFVTALPGILIQLVFIPPVVIALRRVMRSEAALP